MFDIVSGGIEWKSTQPNNKINHSKGKMCCFYHGVIVLMSMIRFSYIFLCSDTNIQDG